MCEVLNADGTPHPTNTRAVLANVANKFSAQKPWFGVEQEYTLYQNDRPFGWPEKGFPHPQGKYYCGVGADEVYGRPVVEASYESLFRCWYNDFWNKCRGYARPMGISNWPLASIGSG